MKKGLLLTAAMGTTLGAAALAHATSGDQMLGITAMEWARGGAVVAAPVDAPSILFNPAAAGELAAPKIGFDLSLGLLGANRDIATKMKSTESESENYLAMGSGVVGRVSDRLAIGLAAGGVAGLGVDFPSTTLPAGASIVSTKGLLKIAPTVAYKVSDMATLGASLQLGYQSLALKTPAFTLPQTSEFGSGGAIGGVVHILPNLQAGVAYTTTLDVGEYSFNGSSPTFGEGTYKMDMDSPQTLAAGLAWKPTPRLLLEADVKWINHSDVMDRVDLIAPNGRVMPLTFGWDDQTTYTLAADFEVIPSVILRAAYNYGASPIEAEDVASNFGSIAVIEHHLSLGVTKKWSDNVLTTLSYTHGFNNEVTATNGAYAIEAQQDIFYLQFSFRM